MELLGIINSDRCSVTCVGYAASQRRRCQNPLATANYQIAESILRDVGRGITDKAGLEIQLRKLAGCLLCRRWHQGQVDSMVRQWMLLIENFAPVEPKVEYDTRCDSVLDDDDLDAELERLRRRQRREVEELLQRRGQRTEHTVAGTRKTRPGASHTAHQTSNSAASTTPASSLWNSSASGLTDPARSSGVDTPPVGDEEARKDRAEASDRAARRIAESRHQEEVARRQREEAARLLAAEHARQYEAEARKREEEAARKHEEEAARKREEEEARLREVRRKAEETRREEARKQASRDRESKAKAKAERARVEEEARVKHETEAEARRARESISWSDAWQRYEETWRLIPNAEVQLSEKELSVLLFWPTRDGTKSKLDEREVKNFFQQQPGNEVAGGSRGRLLRRQAMRWHPDKALRYFAQMQDGEEIMKTVTMIAQVINGLKD